nr:MAG TPA: hypothetical protein [Caudoviricetes sp.]
MPILRLDLGALTHHLSTLNYRFSKTFFRFPMSKV